MPSPVARMMAAFAEDFRPGLDVNLGVGYVNEDTLPRAAIEASLVEVLGAPDRFALNYGSAVGSARLVAATRAFLLRNAVGGLTADVLSRNRLVFGANGATSLLEGFAAVLPRGVVVTTDPHYYIYSSYLERAGFELLPIPEDQAGLRVDLVASHLESVLDRVSFVYVVTVGNPSAAVLSNARRAELARVVARASRRRGRKIPVVFDGAYDLLLHDTALERPRSALIDDDLGIVYELGTFSKVLAPALRAGYVLGPQGPLLDALVQRNNDVGLGASPLLQEITASLLDDHVDAQLCAVNAGYRQKAASTRKLIEAAFGDALEEVSGGQGGFYFYLTLRDVETATGSAFARYAARSTGDPDLDGPSSARRARVAYLPGCHCVHPAGALAARGRRQLRVSYGFESVPRIARGLAVLGEAAAFARRVA